MGPASRSQPGDATGSCRNCDMVGLFMGHRLSVAQVRHTTHTVRTPLRHGVQMGGAQMVADISAVSRSTGRGRTGMADARTARNPRSSTWKPAYGFARDTQQRRVWPNSSLNPSAAFRARTAHSLFHQGFLMEQLNGHAIIDGQHFCGGIYRAPNPQCPTATLGQRAISGCA